MTNQNELVTVQQDWFGVTNNQEKASEVVVVRECACAFN